MERFSLGSPSSGTRSEAQRMAPVASDETADDPRGPDPHREPLDGRIRTLYRDSVKRLVALLDGVFANLEDCLFEIAYISDEPDIHKRCFDLMREMRVQHGAIRRGFARRLLLHLEEWYQFGSLYAFPPDTANPSDKSQAAHRLAARSRAHLAPAVTRIETLLTERITEWHRDSGAADVAAPVFPLAPESVTRVFMLVVDGLDLDGGQRELVLSLFRRYVLDRMGSLIAAWTLELGLLDEDAQNAMPDLTPLPGDDRAS